MSVRGRRTAAFGLVFALLAACGGNAKPESTVTLNWYVGPDRIDAQALATSCNTADYRIVVQELPRDVDDRHQTLVRRLVAKDTSIDLLSLDSAFTAEFAEAQFLAPVPEDLIPIYSKDIVPAALQAATYEEALVVAPWWFDPQLLWYRGNIAERAGLDTTKAVTWDALIAGAQRLGVTVQFDDQDGSGLSEWVNALIAGSDGELIAGTGRNAKVGLDSDAGRSAAGVVKFYNEAKVGPGPSRSALEAFAAPNGGFLLAPSSVISDPAVAGVAADMGWAPYPMTGTTSVSPLAGVGLSVPLYAPHTDLSYKAISCLTAPSVMRAIMSSAGHSSSRITTYDDPALGTTFPMAQVAKAAVTSGRAVPTTPYWNLVRRAIDDSWLPLAGVNDETPKSSQRMAAASLRGDLP
ncbi:multiple sugar transport system substrate-binding protein [Aeromicrobium panaciterrae]|uniref:Multiple sugar transport system substrate-binding protein n=1 Tax=Aeromicrobium panaciterrae TaxID=363861 RepID=A0ABU1ULY2_9ACTN|nr:extracellular solute-binding protein [Aeromicrobium panaciterrae]MDR7086149.1 multiple sugar transport system substrate-binding protein [Aeromicrobium panaciterrae]